MRLHPLAVSLALLLAPACAMNDKDLCPESQGIHCATAPDCTRDSARGLARGERRVGNPARVVRRAQGSGNAQGMRPGWLARSPDSETLRKPRQSARGSL